MDESLKRDEKILALISRLFPRQITKKFKFRVKINKKAYLKMIKNRYMSILLSFKSKDIINGINEIDNKFDKVLKFNDKLICLIINR